LDPAERPGEPHAGDRDQPPAAVGPREHVDLAEVAAEDAAASEPGEDAIVFAGAPPRDHDVERGFDVLRRHATVVADGVDVAPDLRDVAPHDVDAEPDRGSGTTSARAHRWGDGTTGRADVVAHDHRLDGGRTAIELGHRLGPPARQRRDLAQELL